MHFCGVFGRAPPTLHAEKAACDADSRSSQLFCLFTDRRQRRYEYFGIGDRGGTRTPPVVIQLVGNRIGDGDVDRYFAIYDGLRIEPPIFWSCKRYLQIAKWPALRLAILFFRIVNRCCHGRPCDAEPHAAGLIKNETVTNGQSIEVDSVFGHCYGCLYFLGANQPNRL